MRCWRRAFSTRQHHCQFCRRIPCNQTSRLRACWDAQSTTLMSQSPSLRSRRVRGTLNSSVLTSNLSHRGSSYPTWIALSTPASIDPTIKHPRRLTKWEVTLENQMQGPVSLQSIIMYLPRWMIVKYIMVRQQWRNISRIISVSRSRINYRIVSKDHSIERITAKMAISSLICTNQLEIQAPSVCKCLPCYTSKVEITTTRCTRWTLTIGLDHRF